VGVVAVVWGVEPEVTGGLTWLESVVTPGAVPPQPEPAARHSAAMMNTTADVLSDVIEASNVSSSNQG